MRRRAMTFGLLTLGLLAPQGARSQSPEVGPRVWLGVGPIAGGAQGNRATAGGAAHLTGEWGRHHVSLRLVTMIEASSGDDAVGDLALLYGRRRRTDYGYAAVAAGPAGVAITGCDTPSDGCDTVGLSLAAEIGIQGSVVGLAIQAFGNLNSVASFAGLGLMLDLGWMR